MPQPTEDKLLRDLDVGEKFVGFVAVRAINMRQRRDGEPFLVIDFADKSGRMSGKVWEQVEHFQEILEVGQVVKLAGSVTTYQDQKEITIERLRPAKPEDPVEKEKLISSSERSTEEMRRHLRRLIEGVQQPQLRNFLRRFFDDAEISKAYFEAPAGKLWHHAYLGGLAEHSLTLAELLLKIAEFYPHADKDLLVAGALLHDVGKIKEYSWDVTIDFTDRGRLIGHIVIGEEILTDHRKKDPDVPEELWDRLMHLVLSHQGTREQGSPVLPMTLEAILLHTADEMDSKANAFNRIIQRTRERGDKWTEYVKLMDRFLYAGEKKGEPPEGETLF